MEKVKTYKVNSAVSLAEMLYVEKNYTVKAIAEELNKNAKTIASWRDKYKWDDAKELLQASPIELKKLLMREAINITKGEASSFNADSLSKVMKAFDYVAQKTNPTIVMDVLMELDNFHSQLDPKGAAAQTAIHKQFLVYKIEQYGN